MKKNTKSNNDKQLILPLYSDEEIEYKDIVKQNWKFTFSRQHMTSVLSKRVIGLIISQMKEENEVRDVYFIKAIDVIQKTGLPRTEVYNAMKGVIFELVNIVFFFENEEKQKIIPRHLLDTTRYKDPVSYSNGILTIAFNPILKEEVLQLAHYSDYELEGYLKFSSWYSMRFWEILSAYEDTGWWKVSIEEYRDLMGCGLEYTKTGRLRMEKGKPKYIKYPNTSDMIKKTTSEPLNELKGTKFEFTMEILYSNAGRGRPKITGLQFDLIERKLKPEEKTERWSKSSEKFRKAYIRLKKYQVTDVNIVKYSSVIGSERINQLLFAWDEKNRGKNPINNPLVYCNKVFVKEGKAAIENAVNDPDKPQIIRPKPEIKKDNQNKTISENGKAISYEEYKRSKIKDAEIVEESTSVYGGSGEGEVGGFIDVTSPERAIKIKELNKILDQIHNSREKIKEIDKILKEQPSSDLYKMQRKLELEKLKKLEDKGEEIVKTVNQNRV